MATNLHKSNTTASGTKSDLFRIRKKNSSLEQSWRSSIDLHSSNSVLESVLNIDFTASFRNSQFPAEFPNGIQGDKSVRGGRKSYKKKFNVTQKLTEWS
jgi:hypothetical protein